jgi:hypothetical protein
MILLIVLLVFLYAVLSGLLAAWTVWYSGYLYETPTRQMEWRAPAAGGIVFAVLLLWVVLAYRAPGSYRALWDFSSRDVSAPFPDVYVPTEKGEPEHYRYIKGLGKYHQKGNERLPQMKSRPASITVKEGDTTSVFKPERDEKGKLLIRKSRTMFSTVDEPLRYLDESGRVMLEDSLGQITTFKPGNFFLNVFLNLLMLAAWFAALWPVMRFQWAHALGQAAVFWLVMMLFVMPPVLTLTESVAKDRAKAAAAAG